MNMDWYRNKKVVITGGSSGIGKATAILLAKWGAYCCIIGRDKQKLYDASQEIRSKAASPGQKLSIVSTDVSNRRQFSAVAPSIIEKLSGIDILINCAGIAYPAYVDKIPDTVWDSMIKVNYMGTVNAIRVFLPYFMRQRHGHIVNVSSAAGYMGVFGYAAYSASKFAVVGLSECLRQDLLPYNVSISVIYPPDTDTPQWHEEDKTKPPETHALSGNIKIMRPEQIATVLLKGITMRKFKIVPGRINKLTYFLSRHLPGILWAIVSGNLRKYWKKHPADAK